MEQHEHKETVEKKSIDKMTLLSILVAASIVLSLLNIYNTFSLSSKFDLIFGTLLQQVGGGTQVPTGNQPPTGEQQQQQKVQVSVDDDPVKGSADAPVTIVEFSDFQCPFCGRFYSDTLSSIDEKYIKTGKVKLVYRDFPLGFHPFAQKAAEAAECADEQSKFWEMHNKIFENQNAIEVTNLKQYAKDLGLNTGTFDSCLDTGKYAAEVQKDFNDGSSYGVSGTPSFFINGIQVVGAQPASVFEQIIEQELAAA